MRIVFLGTSDVGLPTLEKLVQHHQVVGVLTSPDAPVGRKQVLTPSPIAARAQELGLRVLKPEKVRGNSEVLEELEKLGADIYVVVSYGKILPKELIDAPSFKTLNIHFSLLPQYRGAAPIQAALKNGETVTGTTIFVLDELLDHGPILAQVVESVQADDTFITLANRLAHISAEKLVEILPLYQSGALVPQEQNHERATKAPMLKKEDGKVDWSKTASEIYNQWRAYQPWPGLYTTWNGKLLKIVTCAVRVDSEQSFETLTGSQTLEGWAVNSKPGTVLSDGTIICGQNTHLCIHTLQPEGKQPMDMKSFLNGNINFISSILE